jgi:putative nucleotidyltransferase with HDIG domain
MPKPIPPTLSFWFASQFPAPQRALLDDLLGSIWACRCDSYALWNHSIAVASTARSLAAAAGLPRATQRLAYLGGLLHDVGKTATCAATLFKPGPLTDAERKEMNLHPVTGAGLVRDLGLTVVTDAVHLHHELFDGTGYPFGLRGAEIPVVARVVAVADYYEALRESRPYRPIACSREESLSRLAELGAARRLDPGICRLLGHVVRQTSPAPSKTFERAAQAFQLTF